MVLIIWLLICLVIQNINAIVTDLFIRGRKLNFSLLLHNISLISTHYFITDSQTKKNFCKLHLIMSLQNLWILQKITAKPYYFLIVDATLALNGKNILERL